MHTAFEIKRSWHVDVNWATFNSNISKVGVILKHETELRPEVDFTAEWLLREQIVKGPKIGQIVYTYNTKRLIKPGISEKQTRELSFTEYVHMLDKTNNRVTYKLDKNTIIFIHHSRNGDYCFELNCYQLPNEGLYVLDFAFESEMELDTKEIQFPRFITIKKEITAEQNPLSAILTR